MTLFFPSCLRASVPASITRPMKINPALHINTANIKRRSREQRDPRGAPERGSCLRAGYKQPRFAPSATASWGLGPEQPQPQVSPG